MPASPTALSYTGANQSVTVPAGVQFALVRMWAGGGGSNGGTGGDAAKGGPGGFVKFKVSVTGGETLTARVGGGGTKGVATRGAGAGGGMSALMRGADYLGIAGAGGGGGGYGDSNLDSWGGAGGGTTANAGESNSYATGGGAGTQAAGGAAGTPGGVAGASLQGGNGSGTSLTVAAGWPNGGAASSLQERGGGGGGGYFGGGGGGGNGTWGAGGGGGSSWTTATATDVAHSKGTANDVAAPGTAETGYVSGIAAGGINNTNGGNGRIYIEWLATSTISGTVLDATSAPVARTVRVYERATGTLLGETISSASTGAYSLTLNLPVGDEVQVVCMDDAAGTLENDLVHRAYSV